MVLTFLSCLKQTCMCICYRGPLLSAKPVYLLSDCCPRSQDKSYQFSLQNITFVFISLSSLALAPPHLTCSVSLLAPSLSVVRFLYKTQKPNDVLSRLKSCSVFCPFLFLFSSYNLFSPQDSAQRSPFPLSPPVSYSYAHIPPGLYFCYCTFQIVF